MTDDMTPAITKFACLTKPEVQDILRPASWDDLLNWLAEEPATDHVDAMQHSGWSPVEYDPPKRAKDNVKRAFALVLDHDKGGEWERVRNLWATSYGVMYTTKSHGAPGTTGDRLRVVLPLGRAVSPQEYDRIWEWASKLSRDANCPIDGQAKDVSRFWYDPTKPPGGWRAERLTGVPIDPDAILALAESETPKLRIVQLQPPILNSDFRAERAAKYVQKIPGAVAGDAGHTNTFNAVAHVMFGFDLDADRTFNVIAEHYNPRCDPPWSEKELLHKVQSVAKRCSRSRGYLLNERPTVTSTRAAAHFAPPPPENDLDEDWRSKLLCKKDRSVKRAYYNTELYVRCHPHHRGKWSLDMMTGQPWYAGDPIKDTQVHAIRAEVEVAFGYTPSREDVEAAIASAASGRPFHPILQYLRSLDWDGTSRLSSMARDYLGSESELHGEMVRKFMIGAAARALNPGCKLDTALMLVGAQGIGKSTFFSILGGPWHSDTFVDITNKDSFVQIHSAWIYELSELENVVTGRAESRLKAWLTSTHDLFRAPFSRTAERRARAVVICGTTNRTQFLTDDSGSRRFWIVTVCKEIDRSLLTEMRDQLWAEALCAAESGEPWWLSAESDAARERQNADHREDDEWHDRIADWLKNPAVVEVTVGDLLEVVLKVEIDRQDRWSQMRVARALALTGWNRVRETKPPRRWKYVRPNTQLEIT